MNPERNGKCYISHLTLRDTESLIINNSLGLFKDGSKSLFIISDQTLKSQALTTSDTIQTIKIGNIKISHSLTENQDIAVTIETEAEITPIMCSYRFPFEQKFAYEKAKWDKEPGAT